MGFVYKPVVVFFLGEIVPGDYRGSPREIFVVSASSL
jgi:hypothetical protein